MGLLRICDICGKPMTIDFHSKQFKVKRLKASFTERWWEEIDVHDECMEKLMNGIRNKCAEKLCDEIQKEKEKDE